MAAAGAMEVTKYRLNASAIIFDFVTDLPFGKIRKFIAGLLSWDLTLCRVEIIMG